MLFAWAAQRAPAAIGAICNAMAVLFAALVAFLFFGEKIGMRRALALLVGFAGVVVLARPRWPGLSIGWAVAAGALPRFLYGIGVNLVRRHMAPACRRSRVGGGTLVAAALLLARWLEPLAGGGDTAGWPGSARSPWACSARAWPT